MFNNKKLLVEQRRRNAMKWKEKEKRKEYIALFDDGAIVHCSIANGVQALEKLTADKKAKADSHTV